MFLSKPLNKIAFAFVIAGSFFMSNSPHTAAQNTEKYQPLPAAECSKIRQEMNNVLKVPVMATSGAFTDVNILEKGTGCLLTAKGNGQNFQNLNEVVKDVELMLTQQGWEPDNKYAADGPTGKQRAFRKDNNLALFTVDGNPSEDAKCPDNQPISACNVSPDQMMYEVYLNIATYSGSK
jgi:hypothetical protein